MEKRYNSKTFIAICLLSACASSALQATESLSVASYNILTQQDLQQELVKNTSALRKEFRKKLQESTQIKLDNGLRSKTKLFEKSLSSGTLSKAGVVVLQGWPNQEFIGSQSIELNKTLKLNHHVYTSSDMKNNMRLDKNSFRYGVAIAVKKSTRYTAKPYYYKHKGFYNKKCYIGTDEKQRGDVLAIVLKFETGEKVGIIGCHLEGGTPQKKDLEFDKFYENNNKLSNKHSTFCMYQIQKILGFKKQIETKEQDISSWIVAGDFNWNFDGNMHKYNQQMRGPLCLPRKEWTDADPRAQAGRFPLSTCKISDQYIKNKPVRQDYIFFKGKIKQKKLNQYKLTPKDMLSNLNIFCNKIHRKKQSRYNNSYTVSPIIENNNHAIIMSKFEI